MASNSNAFLSKSSFARMFVYGEAKLKKTWWCAKAAEAGYNVLLIDGDGGAQICRQLKPGALERLHIVNAVDLPGRPVFKQFMDLIARDVKEILWDIEERCCAAINSPGKAYYHIDFTKLTSNDVVIVDSWTALAQSVQYQYAMSMNIDLADANKEDWPGYGYEGRFMNAVLNALKRLKCHVIVIGHSYVYNHMSIPKIPEEKATVDWTKIIPVSVSANHSIRMLGVFTDILYFKRLSEYAIYISTGDSMDFVSGCRNAGPPKQYQWNALNVESMLRTAAGPLTDAPCKAFDFIDEEHPQIKISYSQVNPQSEKNALKLIGQNQTPIQVGLGLKKINLGGTK